MRTTAVVAGLLAALVVLSGVFVGGIAASGTQAQTDSTQDGNETGASFGAEVSSFMQASSAETEGGVENGMFDAALNRTTDPEERRAIVEARIDELEARHQRLSELREGLGNDSNGVRQIAIAAHVMVGAADLEESINETDRAAETAGVDTKRLDTLRANASELSGPEVAEIARGLAGPVENPGRSGDGGPADDVPGTDAAEDEPGQTNSSDGASADAGSGSNTSDGGDGDSGSSNDGDAEPGNERGGGNNDGAEPGNEGGGGPDGGAPP